jgi:putative FmdB family regulatory protein
MPRYTYTCTKCNTTKVESRPVDQRDDRKSCPIWAPTKTEEGPNGETIHTTESECGGELLREGVEMTARMSHAWKV